MDLFEAIEKRKSIRKYKPDKIPEKDLEKILKAAHLAPSGSNLQPWVFIVVREPERKKALAAAAQNQTFIADADVVVAALGDQGTRAKIRLSSSRVPHIQDPMIAVEHMVLAATALGYGTCWIGAFDEAKVKEILKVPENMSVIALLPIGVPNENPPPKPRKPFDQVFCKEVYGVPLKR